MALPALAWELLVREVSDSAARWSFTTSVSSIIDLCAIAAVLRQRKGEIYQHTHTQTWSQLIAVIIKIWSIPWTLWRVSIEMETAICPKYVAI